jgi:hypothetical protein
MIRLRAQKHDSMHCYHGVWVLLVSGTRLLHSRNMGNFYVYDA